jgi:spermidine synthase
LKIDVDELQDRLDRTNFLSLTLSLDSVGFKSATDLLSTYAGRGADLAAWLAAAQLNRDRNLRLQYLAGRGFNSDQGWRIHAEMIKHRAYPEDLFTASALLANRLRAVLGTSKSRP